MTKGKKQMTGVQRCRIEFGLAAGMSERAIAKEIGVSLSTVSREIRKHTYESFKGCYGRANQCVHRQDCKLTGVCGEGTAAKLHIARIDPKEVVLKPRLVGIEMKQGPLDRGLDAPSNPGASTTPQTRLARWAGGAFVSRGQRELYAKTWAHCKRDAGGKPAPYGCAASGGTGDAPAPKASGWLSAKRELRSSHKGLRAASEERGFAGAGGVSHAARDTSRGTARHSLRSACSRPYGLRARLRGGYG